MVIIFAIRVLFGPFL